MARFRFPMFLKFWIGCTALATMLIVGGLLVVRSETRVLNRGSVIERHFERYSKYQEGLGRAAASVAEVLARDPRLGQALAGGPPRDPPGREADGLPAGPPQGPASGAPAAAVAEAMFEQISGKAALRPELFLVFDDHDLVWASPESAIGAADLRELEPVARVRQGGAFFDQTFIHGDRALQLTGVAVRAPGEKRVVGGLLLGIPIERYMDEYRELTDSRKEMQHRMVLVHHGRVIASVFPSADWPELAEQLKEQNWVVEQEGSEKRQFIRLKQGDFEFHHGPAEGFAGVTAGVVGDLFLLRTRRGVEATAPGLPIAELIVGAI
ncbi:MAG TPA: hypothetical protein VEL05_05450, partial [Candidatus Acidoferrum sp.]|nr:hypothetical protein [Candidatus Acidoferrum sp.]